MGDKVVPLKPITNTNLGLTPTVINILREKLKPKVENGKEDTNNEKPA